MSTQTQTATAAATGSSSSSAAPTLVLRAEQQDQQQPQQQPARRGASFLPTLTPPTHILPPLTEFEHSDPGHRALASANPRSVFDAPDVTFSDVTPVFGRTYDGVQLHTLDAAGRDEIALEVARRGVVAFRGQQFAEQGPAWYKQWGSVRRPFAFALLRRPDADARHVPLAALCSTSVACTRTRPA